MGACLLRLAPLAQDGSAMRFRTHSDSSRSAPRAKAKTKDAPHMANLGATFWEVSF